MWAWLGLSLCMSVVISAADPPNAAAAGHSSLVCPAAERRYEQGLLQIDARGVAHHETAREIVEEEPCPDELPSPRLAAYLHHLEAMDRDQGSPTTNGAGQRVRGGPEFIEELAARREAGKNKRTSILYVIYSDSEFYNSRLKWIHETWATQVPKESLLIIGDKAMTNNSLSMHVQATRCPPHSHWEGACCKYAEAIIEAREVLFKKPGFSWVYFTDDDAYVRPDALEKALAAQGGEGSIVLGNWGCKTHHCKKAGLCAGGGYAANYKAIMELVGTSRGAFLKEQMRNCQLCDRWADIALTQAFNARGIHKRPQPGLYGWKLHKAAFDRSLGNPEHEPIMYHYIKGESQMKLLHALFAQAQPPNVTQQASRTGILGRNISSPSCATFRGNTACALSARPKDHPWME